jgi:endonuclease/exonuclease/phosphatase family metal-dependent hydrolase
VTRLQLATFNLFSGRSLTDWRSEGGRLVQAISELGYDGLDLLAVQEVDRGQPRSDKLDQTSLITATLGAVDSRFVATLNGTPGEAGWNPAGDEPVAADRPQFGVGLISRRPVAEWHVLRLPPAPGRYPMPMPSLPGRPPRIHLVRDEPRAAVAAVLIEPRITIATTHLSYLPGSNARQLRRVRDWLIRLPGPVILMGDLNLPGGLPRRITGWTPLFSRATFPSPAPRVQLDHVLAAGLPLGSRAQGWEQRLAISDHRAVRVNLDLPD